MADSSGSRKGLLGCGLVFAGSCVLCCGGGVLGTYFAPDILLWMATADHPIDVPATAYDEAKQVEVRARLYKELDETGATTITAEDINVLAASSGDTRAHVAMVGDELTFDLTTPVEPGGDQHINVHLRTAFVMEGGWFTHLTMPEATLSDWDLGQYMVGQELAMNANQSLAQQRAKDPEMDALIAAVERMAVADGTLQIKMDRAKVAGVLDRSPAMRAAQGVEAPIEEVPATE
ncbi:hypothetical protein LBMAG42_00210 [Deltaproteobacteria bacterium]|nr:hypothetical protein LBMAG42_00210 [Deltaproteobacteria bacterium]